MPITSDTPIWPFPTGNAAIEQYKHLLREHDWDYEYTDDHRVWRLGLEARNRLRGLQKRLDPQATIWNMIAPPSYRITT